MDYKFDFNKFIHRKRMKQKDAATMVGVSMGLIGTWASGKALPSYEKVVKLIECGISAQELFGEELAAELLKNSQKVNPESAEFKEGVKEALREILNLDANL